MEQRADGIHPGIAMSDHHPLRTRRRTAGVISREQIGVSNFRTDKLSRARLEHRLIVQPVLTFSSQCDELFNVWKARPNTIDCAEIVALRANDARTAMTDQVNGVVCIQA